MEPVLTFDEIAAAFRSGGLELSICRTVTRDDFIRLVVGMQWAVACAVFDPLDVKDFSESVVLDDGPRRRVAALPTAADIVDEWLGVR